MGENADEDGDRDNGEWGIWMGKGIGRMGMGMGYIDGVGDRVYGWISVADPRFK